MTDIPLTFPQLLTFGGLAVWMLMWMQRQLQARETRHDAERDAWLAVDSKKTEALHLLIQTVALLRAELVEVVRSEGLATRTALHADAQKGREDSP